MRAHTSAHLHEAALQDGHALLQLLDARANGGQLAVGALQLAVRLRERRPLGSDYLMQHQVSEQYQVKYKGDRYCTNTGCVDQVSRLVDAEVLAYVDDPCAQASSRSRLAADVVGIEGRV